MVLISESQHFPDFLELFRGNFCTIYACSEISGIFGRMESVLDLLSESYHSNLAIIRFFYDQPREKRPGDEVVL